MHVGRAMVHDAPEMMGQDLLKLVAMGRERCSERRGCIIRAMAGYRFMSVVAYSAWHIATVREEGPVTRAAYVHMYLGMQVLRGLPWNWFDCVLCNKKKARAFFVAWDTVRVEGGNRYKCAGFRRALVCARRRAAIYHLAHEGVGT